VEKEIKVAITEIKQDLCNLKEDTELSFKMDESMKKAWVHIKTNPGCIATGEGFMKDCRIAHCNQKEEQSKHSAGKRAGGKSHQQKKTIYIPTSFVPPELIDAYKTQYGKFSAHVDKCLVAMSTYDEMNQALVVVRSNCETAMEKKEGINNQLDDISKNSRMICAKADVKQAKEKSKEADMHHRNKTAKLQTETKKLSNSQWLVSSVWSGSKPKEYITAESALHMALVEKEKAHLAYKKVEDTLSNILAELNIDALKKELVDANSAYTDAQEAMLKSQPELSSLSKNVSSAMDNVSSYLLSTGSIDVIVSDLDKLDKYLSHSKVPDSLDDDACYKLIEKLGYMNSEVSLQRDSEVTRRQLWDKAHAASLRYREAKDLDSYRGGDLTNLQEEAEQARQATADKLHKLEEKTIDLKKVMEDWKSTVKTEDGQLGGTFMKARERIYETDHVLDVAAAISLVFSGSSSAIICGLLLIEYNKNNIMEYDVRLGLGAGIVSLVLMKLHFMIRNVISRKDNQLKQAAKLTSTYDKVNKCFSDFCHTLGPTNNLFTFLETSISTVCSEYGELSNCVESIETALNDVKNKRQDTVVNDLEDLLCKAEEAYSTKYYINPKYSGPSRDRGWEERCNSFSIGSSYVDCEYDEYVIIHKNNFDGTFTVRTVESTENESTDESTENESADHRVMHHSRLETDEDTNRRRNRERERCSHRDTGHSGGSSSYSGGSSSYSYGGGFDSDRYEVIDKEDGRGGYTTRERSDYREPGRSDGDSFGKFKQYLEAARCTSDYQGAYDRTYKSSGGSEGGGGGGGCQNCIM
jgi:hypothetical protein